MSATHMTVGRIVAAAHMGSVQRGRFDRAVRGEVRYEGSWEVSGLTALWQDFTETRVPVRGGELEVVRWAAREPGAPDVPTIMVMHGITANALSWAAVADEIAGRAELIAVDLRGRAGSRASRAPGWSIDQDAADLVAVLDALELDHAVLAGHSLGAFVATAAAAASPERFSRVVAVDGGRLPAAGRSRPGRGARSGRRSGGERALDDLRRRRGVPRLPPRLPRVHVTFVPGTNHYTILGPGVGSQAVTRALLG